MENIICTACMHVPSPYRGIFSILIVYSILAEGATSIQLYVEFIVITSRAIDVHTIGIVSIASWIDQTAKRTIETDTYLHVIILALSLDICKTRAKKQIRKLTIRLI